MVDRISTGLSILDQALEGGYPTGAVIGLFGKTTISRTRLIMSFLNASSSNKLYINTRHTVPIIKQEASLHQCDLSSTSFLDAVHWRSKRVNPKLETEAEFEVSNLTDLNSLLAKIMEACSKNEIEEIVFDSPSSILLYTTPGKEQVYKFFELLTSYVRSNGITLCFTLEEGVHSDEIISTMQFLSDGVIWSGLELSDGIAKQVYQVEQMSLTNFTPGRIELTEE